MGITITKYILFNTWASSVSLNFVLWLRLTTAESRAEISVLIIFSYGYLCNTRFDKNLFYAREWTNQMLLGIFLNLEILKTFFSFWREYTWVFLCNFKREHFVSKINIEIFGDTSVDLMGMQKIIVKHRSDFGYSNKMIWIKVF